MWGWFRYFSASFLALFASELQYLGAIAPIPMADPISLPSLMPLFGFGGFFSKAISRLCCGDEVIG